ncbi:NACHT domain-containing protein [Actinoplanes sp. NPDC051859]|uniref:NACHT domain-containing protein n=1 Tax=Actinoplanes sp. NPDC051859 TaxID=3363909 RepID=UPI003794BC7E
MLLGSAGSGKSTLVATIVREIAENARHGNGRVVAVACPAADLARHQLAEALAVACSRDYRQPVPAALFQQPPMFGGRWQVLIDGVDEVVDADARSRTLWRLHDLLDKDSELHQIVVTSRPLPAQELADLRVTGVAEYELRPFDRADLAEFAARWFSARQAGHPEAPERRAAMFLARVAGARLGPVARVPLLATIAAMVYEQAEDRALPTSRAELYEQFVECMLDGRGERGAPVRGLATALSTRGRAGATLADWIETDFHAYVLALLHAVAAAHLDDPDRDLVEVAVDWLDRTAPQPLTSVLPDARRIVADLLRATALLVPRQGRLAFVHQSFAEFLVTRTAETSFDPQAWLALAANPGTRSRAGFAAAQRHDADKLVGALLDESGNVVAAGDMIADGVRIGERLRERVLAELVRALVDDGPAAGECLRVLRELSVDGDILTRLVRVAEDSRVDFWIRAVVADAIADVDLPTGARALRDLRQTAPSEVAQWITAALQTRGIVTGDSEREEITAGRPRTGQALGRIGRAALAQQASNPEVGELQRLDAAIRLCADGEQAPLRAFLDESGTERFVRLRAAVVLADYGDDQPLRVLAAGPESPRPWGVGGSGPLLAARNLARRDPGSGPVIRQLISRSDLAPCTVLAAALLSDLGDSGELERLTHTPIAEAIWSQSTAVPALLGLAAAREVGRRGVPESLHRALAGNPEPAARAYLLAGLMQLGDLQAARDLELHLREHRLPAWQRVELHGVLARHGRLGSRRWLHRRVRPWQPSSRRMAAAVALGDDPAAAQTLNAMAGNRWLPARVRVRAAEAACREPAQAGAALSTLVGPARVRLTAATRLARRFGDERAIDRLLADPAMHARHRKLLVEFVTDGLNPTWPRTEQQLLAHGDWGRWTAAGTDPFAPGFPFPIRPRQPAARAASLLRIANDPAAAPQLRLTAAAACLPDPAAAGALTRLIRQRAVRAGTRRQALVTLAAWLPQDAEPLVREAVRDRWLPRVTTWRLLHRTVIEPDEPALAAAAWTGFTAIEQAWNEIGDDWTLLSLLRIAGLLLTRPRLDD